jgi:hypothetical protein
MVQPSTHAHEATMSQDASNTLKKLTYTHEAMIDLILQEPTVTYKELAEVFGFSEGWISRVVGSDAFNARLAERKAALIDPIIARSLNERLRSVTVKAIDMISEKLSSDEAGAAYALDALGIATSAMTKVK